ncbi:small GTP-binding protein [Tritrichomonas foetus]|uniref:Small GTP-binding protein n=1 Tax=Tritrichomonas foetus TaxID=1144522 RepID=A0A1J4JNX4_9EUKA|nr:small GTP-binding protein [Tritrichomonas foetus]|eukprot:OHS99219.1 small GTP-binding protein [Tritrichomonas foetus]
MLSAGETNNAQSHKVVILGDSRVGKTSILTRQMLGYQPPTQNPTIGCHCSEIHVTVEGKATTLQVWDTAGQEMYRALVPVYLRGAQAAILVYDITDRESFKSINHWYDILVDVVSTGTPIFLVGNKIDLEKDSVVDDQSARAFATSHNSQLYKVSAMTGQGLDALFQAIAGKILEDEVNDKTVTGVALESKGEKKKCC